MICMVSPMTEKVVLSNIKGIFPEVVLPACIFQEESGIFNLNKYSPPQ